MCSIQCISPRMDVREIAANENLFFLRIVLFTTEKIFWSKMLAMFLHVMPVTEYSTDFSHDSSNRCK